MKNALPGHSFSLFIVSILLALTLPACSGMAQREDERERIARYHDYAGEPIEHFNYLGRFDGWRALGPNQLVVWTTLDQPYLLTVAGTCPDLPSATLIGVTSKRGEVSRGFDAITLANGQRCTISEIRPIDMAAMKQEEAERRE